MFNSSDGENIHHLGWLWGREGRLLFQFILVGELNVLKSVKDIV